MKNRFETKPKLRETFVLSEDLFVLAFEAKTAARRWYEPFVVPANHPVWPAKTLDHDQINWIDCWQTKYNGVDYCFQLGTEEHLAAPVSVLRALWLRAMLASKHAAIPLGK